eukprot:Stramenopile-MAST_4_protein_2219
MEPARADKASLAKPVNWKHAPRTATGKEAVARTESAPALLGLPVTIAGHDLLCTTAIKCAATTATEVQIATCANAETTARAAAFASKARATASLRGLGIIANTRPVPMNATTMENVSGACANARMDSVALTALVVMSRMKPAFPGQMWTGASCEAKTCSKNCTGRGVCDKNGECLCNPDWMGISCEKPACPYACHGNGKCVEGTCKCDDMWSGEACEQRQYWCPKDCSGRGTCVKSTNGTHSCKCNKLPVKAAVRSSLKAMFEGQQWAGPACDTLSCPANDNGEECSLHGSCKNGKCQCDELYSGHMCQISSCKDGCNFHGTCKKGPNGVAFCKCEDGFAGSDCAKKICPGNGECSKHGDCNEKRATCKCHAGWEGPGCAKPICPDNCNNHGE